MFIFSPLPRLASAEVEVKAGDSEPPRKKAKGFYSNFDTDHVLAFTEDKIDSMLILLRIAHLQFDNVLKLLPYEFLHGAAVLCEQYACKS